MLGLWNWSLLELKDWFGILFNYYIVKPIPTNDAYYEHYAPDYRLHYNVRILYFYCCDRSSPV